MLFNIATHNGKITIKNPLTGNHRTFRVRTQPKDAHFAPGQRIVSLLTGPDNERDYQQFGFVSSCGRINLWTKYRTDLFRTYANMLEEPDRWTGKVEYLFEGRCRICNRTLTEPESISSGIGPVCAGRS